MNDRAHLVLVAAQLLAPTLAAHGEKITVEPARMRAALNVADALLRFVDEWEEPKEGEPLAPPPEAKPFVHGRFHNRFGR